MYSRGKVTEIDEGKLYGSKTHTHTHHTCMYVSIATGNSCCHLEDFDLAMFTV